MPGDGVVAVTVPFAGQAAIYARSDAVAPAAPWSSMPRARCDRRRRPAVAGASPVARLGRRVRPRRSSATARRVVAGFHTIAAEALAGPRPARSTPTCSCVRDDAEAKERVGALIEGIPGMRWVDAAASRWRGSPSRSRRSSSSINRTYKVKDSGFRIVGRDAWGRAGRLVDHREDLAGLDDLTRVDREVGDLSLAGRGDVVLHLHRLEDADHVAGAGPPDPSRPAPSRSCPASARGSRRARARRGARRSRRAPAARRRAVRRRSAPGTRRPSTSTRMSRRPVGCRASRSPRSGCAGRSRLGERPLEPGGRVRCRAELLRLEDPSVHGDRRRHPFARRTRRAPRSIRCRACLAVARRTRSASRTSSRSRRGSRGPRSTPESTRTNGPAGLLGTA